MNKVHLVVDSTAGVPQAELLEYDNLHVVPLKVILGEQIIDESELTADEIFEFCEPSRAFPKTSQPAPGEFAAVFEKLVAQGDSVVAITLSSAVSGTYQCVKNVAATVGKNKVFVVDSRTAGIGLLHLVREGLKLIEQGKTADDIAKLLGEDVKRNRVYILVGSLDYLRKGGRIGGAAALAGSLLQIKPILTLSEGKVAVLDKVRTLNRAVQRLLEELPDSPKQIEWIGVTHSGTIEEAKKFAELVEKQTGVNNIEITGIGAVLAVHFGPGCVAVMVQRRTELL